MNQESIVQQRPGLSERIRRRLPAGLKRTVRRLLEVPSRLGHAGRRRRAERWLTRDIAPVSRVLVMCTGNICRSPYVARKLEARYPAGARILIASAGFLRSDRPSPIEARDAARRRGVDLDTHRSVKVEPADLEAAGLILVMEPAQRGRVAALAPGAAGRILLLGELDPAAFQTPDVPDPWGHPPSTFDRCYERLDRCVDRLAALLDEGTPHEPLRPSTPR